MTHAPAPIPAHRIPTAIPVATPVAVPVTPLPVAAAVPVVQPISRPWIVRAFRNVYLAAEWVFGCAVLFVGLAVLSAVPVLQLLSLGYLLESAARVSRTGKLREAFIGVRTAARLGGIVACSWLLLLPARFVSDLAHSAATIDPGSRVAESWRTWSLVLIVATFVHILAAVARGGRVRHFLWPFNFVWLIRRALRGGYYTEARDATWNALVGLRLPYYLRVGFLGFVAGFAWLVVPVTLLAARQFGGGGAAALGVLGGALLALVLMYLPFLQLRMAVQNRFAAAFEVLAVRREYRRAPWAFTVALIVTLASALPLYLLKVEIIPREAAWLPGLVFMAFIIPARVLTGWAFSRALKRPTPRHWFWRWTARFPILPATIFYVIVVFFTQYTSWNGVWSLYEQHAFLLPVPVIGG